VEYTFDLFAEDIDFMLRQLDVRNIIFIGWSKGVSIGLVYAAAHAEYLSKLVLVGGGPKFLKSDDFEPGLDPGEFERTVQQMREDFDAGVWSFIHAEIPEPDTQELKEWVFSLSKQTTPEVALNSILNDTRYDLRPSLRKISTPTLVCYGELDVICPPGASQILAAGLVNAEIHEFPALGHFPFLTDPELFNARLQSFLAG
jgi:pimeloyl-[acyl-carrier protein] methyl ester esterase